MNNPAVARTVVLRRDRYTCQDCGHADRQGRFDVDHKKPLFEANGDATYWQLSNLVLLCDPCHKRKTLDDMERYREGVRRAKVETAVSPESSYRSAERYPD